MSSDDFYANLPVLDDFPAISRFSSYRALPDDWMVVVADIEDSTSAIAAGQYKAVNILGVSIIASATNIAKPLSIPSVFGGDGAIVCIPGKLADEAAAALQAVKIIAIEQYGLNLRAGIFPMQVIHEAGYCVLVARHRMSEHYVQAAFTGGGTEYAEQLLKDETGGRPYRLTRSERIPRADFSGLECRWDNVPSKRGEIIALIVKVLAASSAEEARIYAQIITRIDEIYGEDELSHPVHIDGLQLPLAKKTLEFESKLKNHGRSMAGRIGFFLRIRLEVLLGRLFMRLGIKTGATDWGNYRKELVKNTDFKKFDGMLRQVRAGTARQRRQLSDYLEARYRQGDCIYGIHHADSALVTCIVGDRAAGAHYHFVDGADGGYALAARAMKRRLERLSAR